MSNPFSVLEELSSPTKVQKKAPAKKKASTKKDNKKNTKAETKQTPTPSLNANAQKRKPKRLIPEENASTTATSETTSETPVEKKEEKKSAPRDRNFDGPDNLKNYKRDGNKAYFNRKPGQAPVKGGKRYEQKDRSVNRTGKKFQRYGPKGGEGGKGNWYGKVDNPSRYLKKKPQEMNDEEWDKLMKVDEQKQKKDAQRGQKRKPVKKVEKKTEESKDKTDAVVATESSEKKPFKKDGDKKRPFKKDGERRKPFKKDFKKKPFKKDDDGIVLPEVAEDESDDEGKETYEDFIKARKKPVTLNDSQERKAGEGVKIAKQKEFVRNLDRSNQTYMKVSKKKPAKKEKKEEASTEPKTEDAKVKVQKKKKKKVLSTTEFFKGSDVPKKSGFKNKKAGNKKTGNKKNVPDFKDSQSFPSLS